MKFFKTNCKISNFFYFCTFKYSSNQKSGVQTDIIFYYFYIQRTTFFW